MGEKEKLCHHCNYYGPHSQDPTVPDYWCFRHDMRAISKYPGCPNYEERKGGEFSVNAPYIGLIEREKDRKNKLIKIEQNRTRDDRKNILYGVVVGAILTFVISYVSPLI